MPYLAICTRHEHAGRDAHVAADGTWRDVRATLSEALLSALVHDHDHAGHEALVEETLEVDH